jgi:hypothetical protein
MSYHYEFDSRNRLLLAVAYDRVDDSELRELYFGIRKRKDEDHALTGVLDLTEVTDFDVRSEIIRGLADMPPNFQDPTLRAVVAPFCSGWRACFSHEAGLLASNCTSCDP